MDNESIYELQLIDCNCNNCIFMERDFPKFEKWKEFQRGLQYKDYENRKEREIRAAEGTGNERVIQKAKNIPFLFDQTNLIQYGNCTKFDKAVSFIPNVCQLETQGCFKHRKTA